MRIKDLEKAGGIQRMGLGLAALGRPGYINLGHGKDLGGDKSVESLRAQAHKVLDAAWQAGVRYFDAARSYGQAEKFLADWLAMRDIEATQVIVGSKWGYTYTAEWQVDAEHHEIKEHSLAVLTRQIKESREMLGKHLKLYQTHSATQESGVLENKAVLDKLAELKDEGLIIGLSLSGPGQAETLEEAMDVQYDGQPLFGSVQATWNLLETSVGAALQAAHEAGLTVIIKEALANGRLTARNTQDNFINRLAKTAEQNKTTIDALALAAALAQPWAGIVLSGAANEGQLRSNLAAAGIKLRAETLEEILSLAETPEDYWASRSQLAWN